MDRIKILITGANGFIGKSITELLDPTKYEAISKTRKELDVTNLDLVKNFFDTTKVDYVIHCATAGGRRNGPDNPRIFYENTKMFENLILFKDRFKSMVVFGSGAELESEFPLNYYGLSKKYITEKINKENLNCINLRLWGCFGKHETSDRFIKANLIRYKNKHPMIIHQNKTMDFFYVNDIIPIIEWLFTGAYIPFKTLSLSYNHKMSLQFIASNIINKLEDYEVPIIIDDSLFGKNYNGQGIEVELFNFIGLKEGIKKVWQTIK